VSSATESALVEFEDVAKDYLMPWPRGSVSRALDGVSFIVPRGSTLALLGPNGAGKSTTLHLMLGFLRPGRGTVRVCGEAPQDPASRRSLGFLPEVFAFDRFSTGRRLLERFDALSCRDREGREARVARALETVQMSESADRRVGTYSKGMTQRIGLAQAIVGDPDLLVLDEPMSGMDPASRHAVKTMLAERRALSKTTVISSHILPEVQAAADTLVILDRGRVVARGSLDALTSASTTACISFRAPEATLLAERLAAAGLPSPKAGPDGVLSMDVRPPAEVNQALAVLMANGAEIVSIERAKQDLESVFLALTRDSASSPWGPS